MKSIRAFFCLPLPDTLLNDLAKWLRDAETRFRENRVFGARFVPRFNLHITLRFCGEIPEQTANALDKCLTDPIRDALAAMPELTIENTGTFGRPPRVLWAGLGGGVSAVRSLNETVERACQAEGLEPDDKRFSPHLTLARFGDPRAAKLDLLPEWTLTGRGWKPDRVILMRSVLSPSGARYSPLSVYQA
ncbi:MAG: RNA 2',3'-cyclic phosphodiesterase [Pyramidobacter sp.]|nr:RNA 2',3'-cyclic phosphodiesterase [Pyramidobacter sp.]